MELIIWKNMPCHLLSSYIRELASIDGVDVTVFVDQEMMSFRAELGWQVPDLGKAKIVVNPDRQEIRKAIAGSSPDSIHILNGYRKVRLLERALLELLRSNRRFGLLAEPGVAVGLKGLVGPVVYRIHSLRFWNRFDFIFAMGLRGADWFHARGYPRDRIFPFAYTPEAYEHPPAASEDSDGPVHIVFVGQLIRRKGLDVALRALAELRDQSWKLSIIGTGERRSELERLTRKHSIEDRVHFLGAKKNKEITDHLETADLLILPSRYDGWGAVSNEALMCGVPVICSSQCGSKDLLREPERGEVFEAGSVTELRQLLRKWIARGRLKSCQRERIRNWSQCISGRSAADYFLNAMKHVYGNAPRPVAPWL